MCLDKIKRAITETENELRKAAGKVEKMTPANDKLLADRLRAFSHLQATLELIRMTHYHPCDTTSEDPCFPPKG